jgi:hypothetical protein
LGHFPDFSSSNDHTLTFVLSSRGHWPIIGMRQAGLLGRSPWGHFDLRDQREPVGVRARRTIFLNASRFSPGAFEYHMWVDAPAVPIDGASLPIR